MKHFKLSKKSLMSFALSVIMLVSMSSMAMLCYADIIWEHPTTLAFNVTLYADQTKTYSGALIDPYIRYEGKNHGGKNVYFTPQYTFASDQSGFKDDTRGEYESKPGEQFVGKKSSSDYNKPWWRLCLNPKGLTSGGKAYGWCW